MTNLTTLIASFERRFLESVEARHLPLLPRWFELVPLAGDDNTEGNLANWLTVDRQRGLRIQVESDPSYPFDHFFANNGPDDTIRGLHVLTTAPLEYMDLIVRLYRMWLIEGALEGDVDRCITEFIGKT